MSKYSKDADNTKQFIPIIPQLSSMGGGNGLIGGQQRLQIILPTGSVAYDVNNSAFKYVTRFFLNTECPVMLGPGAQQQPFFGTYTLFQGAWWFQEYVLANNDADTNIGQKAQAFTTFDAATGVPYDTLGDNTPPYAYNLQWVPTGDAFPLSSGPENAMCILFQSQTQYNQLNDDDLRPFRHHLKHQLELDPHVQDTQYHTWFMGTKPCITFSFLPYVIDQVNTLKDGTPNPRYGTKVADGRFYNPNATPQYVPTFNNQFSKPCIYKKVDGVYRIYSHNGVEYNQGDLCFTPPSATAAPSSNLLGGSWIYGTNMSVPDTDYIAYEPTQHAWPDLSCGYTFTQNSGTWQISLTPAKGGMDGVICTPTTGYKAYGAKYLFVQNVEFSIPLRFLNCVFDTDNPLFFANMLKTASFSIWLTPHQQLVADVFGNTRMFGEVLPKTTTTSIASGTPTTISRNAVAIASGAVTVNNLTVTESAVPNGIGTVSLNDYLSATSFQTGATTAIIDGYFFSSQKESAVLTSDLNMGNYITSKTDKWQWTPIGTFTANNTGLQNYPVMKTIKNMKGLQILLAPNDTGCVDNGVRNEWIDSPKVVTSSSLYLHQHSTLMTENQFLQALNQATPDVTFNYLYEFNVRLSNKPTAYMYQGTGAGLRQINDFLHETLASSNLLCNTKRCSMPYVFQYGDNCLLYISAEHFSNLMREDISFDGVDTTGQPVMLQWAIGTYSPDIYNPASKNGAFYSNTITNGVQASPVLHQNGYILEVLQQEEQWVVIDPINGSIQKLNDIRGLGRDAFNMFEQ